MKKEFSTMWNRSRQRRKQRKYLANAPLHIKRKMLGVNLSKELRKKYKKRNIVIRKGDIVKVIRGKFRCIDVATINSSCPSCSSW